MLNVTFASLSYHVCLLSAEMLPFSVKMNKNTGNGRGGTTLFQL